METENNEGGAPCASSEATLDHVKELETENAGLKAQIASLTADIQAAQGSQKAAMAAAKNPAPQAGKSNLFFVFTIVGYLSLSNFLSTY